MEAENAKETGKAESGFLEQDGEALSASRAVATGTNRATMTVETSIRQKPAGTPPVHHAEAGRMGGTQVIFEVMRMGLLSRMLGHASEADIESVEKTLEHALADDETVEKAFQLMRDLIIFTNRRMILIDRQGVTGRKTEYHSVPYRAVTHFSVESAGTFDLEAELKIWISSTRDPIQKTFSRGQTIFEVQKALAAYVGR